MDIVIKDDKLYGMSNDSVLFAGKEYSISGLLDENEALKKQISELESELAAIKKNLDLYSGIPADANVTLKIAGLSEKEIEHVQKEVDKYYKQAEQDRIDKLEKRIAHLEDWLAEEKERKIKELEAEQALLMAEAAHSRFINSLVRPLR